MVAVNKALAFVSSMLSEADGTASTARVCILIVIAFASGWVTALVTKVPGPVSLIDLAAFVGQLGMYVSAICVSLYGVNKFSDALKNRADREGPPAQQAGDPPAQK